MKIIKKYKEMKQNPVILIPYNTMDTLKSGEG